METSVIIPVYNSKKYIEAIIGQVLEEKRDFEIILIDDGSTDGSAELCDKLSELNESIKVFHKSNGGISSARNYGIAMATGKYIMFADNDDDINAGFIDDNIKLAIEKDADMVRFGYCAVDIKNGSEIKTIYNSVDSQVITKKEYLKKYFLIRNSTVWNCVYKNEILKNNKITFDETLKSGGEDTLFNTQYIEVTEKIVFNKKIYYKWLHRYNHSTSRKFDRNLIIAKIKNFAAEVNFVNKCKILDTSVNLNEYLFQLFVNYIYSTVDFLVDVGKKEKLKNKKECLSSFRKSDTVVETIERLKNYKSNNKKNNLIYGLFMKKYYSLLILVVRIQHSFKK